MNIVTETTVDTTERNHERIAARLIEIARETEELLRELGISSADYSDFRLIISSEESPKLVGYHPKEEGRVAELDYSLALAEYPADPHDVKPAQTDQVGWSEGPVAMENDVYTNDIWMY